MKTKILAQAQKPDQVVVGMGLWTAGIDKFEKASSYGS